MIQDNYGNKRWYKEGKFHREDGPAIEYADGRKEYWKNDRKWSESELRKIGLCYNRCKKCNREYIKRL